MIRKLRSFILGAAAVALMLAFPAGATAQAPFQTTMSNDNCVITATYQWSGMGLAAGTTYVAKILIDESPSKSSDLFFYGPDTTITTSDGSVSFSHTFDQHKYTAFFAEGYVLTNGYFYSGSAFTSPVTKYHCH